VYSRPLSEIRIRTKIPQVELAQKIGKIVTDDDYGILLTGPTRVIKPDGRPLCVYLPKAISEENRALAWPIVSELKGTTGNRGYVSAAPGYKDYKQTRFREVASHILGNFEAAPPRFPACRLTAWTIDHPLDWPKLFPLCQEVNHYFAQNVPDRWNAQMHYCEQVHPEWMIPGTVFGTLTVNLSYSTGVHQDDGDLREGFSCIAVFKQGEYTGGVLTFPEYRIAVNLQDRDLLLMDAGEFHGNSNLELLSEDAKRVSVVFYMRSNMHLCGSPKEEAAKMTSR